MIEGMLRQKNDFNGDMYSSTNRIELETKAFWLFWKDHVTGMWPKVMWLKAFIQVYDSKKEQSTGSKKTLQIQR